MSVRISLRKRQEHQFRRPFRSAHHAAWVELPWQHRKFVRTTNWIERSFVQERRRTKTLPRFFTEKSCLKLVHGTLIRAGACWQRIHVTPLELEQIRLLDERRELTPVTRLEAVA